MIPVYCPLCCDQPFEDQQTLFFHLRGVRNNLFCPICSQRFASLEYLVNHLARKCDGPMSPTDAKRKCLSSSKCNEDESIRSSVDSLASEQTQDKAVIDLFNHDSSGEPVNATGQTVPPNSDPLSSIPPTLVQRLSKSVTLSVEPVKKPAEQKNANSVSLSAKLTPKKSDNCAPDNTLQKLSLNSAIDFKPTTLNVKNRKSREKSSLSVTSTNLSEDINCEVQVIAESPGRLSSKSRFKSDVGSHPLSGSNHKENSKSEKSLQDISESDLAAVTPISDTSTRNSVSISSVLATTCTNTPPAQQPRKRGRPRKYPVGTVIDYKKKRKSLVTSPTDKPINVQGETTTDMCIISKNTMDGNTSDKEEIILGYPMEDSMDGSNSAGAVSQEENEKVESEEIEEYTCSACQIRFASIYNHIKEHHNGEEVVVEVPEEEIKEDLKVYQSEKRLDSAVDPLFNAVDSAEVLNGNEFISSTISRNLVSIPPTTIEKTSKTSNISKTNIYTKPSIDPFESTKGEWVQTVCNQIMYYQFVRDRSKLKTIIDEMKDNKNIHPIFNVPVNELLFDPKINLIEITYKPKTPIYVHRAVDLGSCLPIYVVERQPMDSQMNLGGIASFVITNTSEMSFPMSEDSKLIAVVKVVLTSDKKLTVENMVFKDKPMNVDMIPVLEDVLDPEIPLLKGGKMLKWKCLKCLATTWKFPITKDSHLCFACSICHKPFISRISLVKHMVVHETEKGSDNHRYCEECQAAFVSNSQANKHMKIHDNHTLCNLCKLLVPNDQVTDHQKLHQKSPQDQFPCSLCRRVFGSTDEVKNHRRRVCNRLLPKYKCRQCDKKFFSVTALSYHIQVHKSVKITFPCRYCNKSFLKETEQMNIKAGKRKPSSFIQKLWHERIHSRDRPFLCASCPKRFRNQLHHAAHVAKVHTATIHRPVPIHMCHVCDKVFRSAPLLKLHLVQHNIT